MKNRFKKLNFLIVFFAIFIILPTYGIERVSASSLTTICGDKSPNGTNDGYTAGTNAGSGAVSNSAFCSDQKNNNDPVIRTLNDAINIITAIAGLVAVIMIIVSGLQMISSSGNSEKISNARNTILYASIGLVVIAVARIIIGFIINKVA
jgi:hypothetical protein